MPLFPKVTSPCPYKSQLASVMDGDFCRMCQWQVFDLNAFSDGERRAFLAGCGEEEVCVSYRVPLRAAMAAAALAVATPAVAQDVAAPSTDPAAAVESDVGVEEIIVIAGGIKNPASAEMVAVEEDTSVPELPVVYEEANPSRDEPVDQARKSM